MTMRLHVIITAALLGAAATQVPAQGVTYPAQPPKDSFFVDEAGLIAEAEGQAINEVAAALWSEQQIPIIVVTIESLMAHGAASTTIERYAHDLFNHLGIGSERRNYGMLLLVSRGDRRARIELGAGWGARFDMQAQEVMDTLILPEFRKDQYSAGILAGVRGMDAMARGLDLPKPKTPWWVIPLGLILLAVVIGVIISLFKSGHKGWGWALIVVLGVLLFFMLKSAASGRGSGGAFGGGFSGGGGASGSW